MQIMSVSDFVAYVNETFKAIWDPHAVAVEGEVTGFRVSQGQWVNFEVKDDGALVSVFMVLRNLTVPLQDGMRVRLQGYPKLYPKYGKFSFQAERVELVGEGALRKALAMLREKLAAEGLFEPTRKRALPRFPQRIALIASRESAAYGDFIRIVNERWGGLQIDLYHVLVQGEQAPAAMVRALAIAQDRPYDALVITRGGGSFEELMAFNDERLVRAIHACRVPTLVGVGHERDLTLAEEAADVRGSTPTDCARRLVPDRAEMIFQIASTHETIHGMLENWLQDWTRRSDEGLRSAERWVRQVKQRSTVLAQNVSTGAERWSSRLAERVDAVSRLLVAFHPQGVLRRGYAILRDEAGNVIPSVKGLTIDQGVSFELRDGSAQSVVTSIKPKLL